MSKFIGLGTGRCGTMSLCKILSQCDGVQAMHEYHDLQWYVGGDSSSAIQGLIHEFTVVKDGETLGHVANTLLPSASYLMKKVPSLKIVYLWRDTLEVINSFMKWCGGEGRLRPIDKIEIQNNPKAQRIMAALPMIDAHTPQQSLDFFCKMYEAWINELAMEYVPQDRFISLNVKDLNDDEKLKELYDFLKIPEEKRVYPEKRKFNSNASMLKPDVVSAGRAN